MFCKQHVSVIWTECLLVFNLQLSFQEWTQQVQDMLNTKKFGDIAFRDKDYKNAIEYYSKVIPSISTFRTPIFCRGSDNVSWVVQNSIFDVFTINILIIFENAASINDVSSFWYRLCETSALVLDGRSTRTRIERRNASSGMLARVADFLLHAGSCPLKTRNGVRRAGHAQRRSLLRSEEAKHMAQLSGKR